MPKNVQLYHLLVNVEVCVSLTHYTLFFSIPPENVRKPLSLLMFLGGLEKPHRAVMG